MFIARVRSEYANDFSADMECEHCHGTQALTTGYHDTNYHTRVIPAMFCRHCGKNRRGETDPEFKPAD